MPDRLHAIFIGHFEATPDRFSVPATKRAKVLAFAQSTKREIVG